DRAGEGRAVDAVAEAAGILGLSLRHRGCEFLEAGLPCVVFLAGVLPRIVGELPAGPARGTLADACDRLAHGLRDAGLARRGGRLRDRNEAGGVPAERRPARRVAVDGVVHRIEVALD